MVRRLAFCISFFVVIIVQTTGFNLQSLEKDVNTNVPRRTFFDHVVSAVIIGTTTTVLGPSDAAHATRAVGGAEEDCRAAGNCLERGELDGALGWSWGAKDRCDAMDPRCGADGRLTTDANAVKLPVPAKPTNLDITDVAEISLTIGRTEEARMRIGLYGGDAEAGVEQFLRFLSRRGLTTQSDFVIQNGIGVQTQPVSLTRGGSVVLVVPGQRISFGVPLQSTAYARSKGLTKAGEDFVPQPRPKQFADFPVLRKHDAPGLISIPSKGIGYGGTGFETDDECYESAFSITAAAVPSLDKEDRRVIGQLMDEESMSTLSRLANLPTKKGFKGIIPGQTSGPPLLRVTLNDVEIQSRRETSTTMVTL